MYPYFILLFLVLIISIFRKKIGDKNYLRIVFFMLFVFLILKDYTKFSDHEFYKELFSYMCKNGLVKTLNTYSVEEGYILYNFFISLLTNNYGAFLVITGAVSLIGPYLFIKRNSKNYLMSIIIFIGLNFYSMNFYVLRAGMALSIFLIGFNYIKDRKLFKYLLITLIAGTFHKTILVFIPFYYLLNINYSKIALIGMSSVFVLVFILRKFIVALLVEKIYSYYDISSMAGQGYKLLMVLIIVTGYFLYQRNNIIKKDGKSVIFINMLLYSIIFQMFATILGPINRITTYFMISLVILIPNYICQLENLKIKKILEILTIVIGIALFCNRVFEGTAFCEYDLIFFS